MNLCIDSPLSVKLLFKMAEAKFEVVLPDYLKKVLIKVDFFAKTLKLSSFKVYSSDSDFNHKYYISSSDLLQKLP